MGPGDEAQAHAQFVILKILVDGGPKLSRIVAIFFKIFKVFFRKRRVYYSQYFLK
jgi:hypothetical protein